MLHVADIEAKLLVVHSDKACRTVGINFNERNSASGHMAVRKFHPQDIALLPVDPARPIMTRENFGDHTKTIFLRLLVVDAIV